MSAFCRAWTCSTPVEFFLAPVRRSWRCSSVSNRFYALRFTSQGASDVAVPYQHSTGERPQPNANCFAPWFIYRLALVMSVSSTGIWKRVSGSMAGASKGPVGQVWLDGSTV